MSGLVIAIDGPSGVGKSSVSREVAKTLGLSYLDTGATFRAAALYCQNEGIDIENEDDVAGAAEFMNLEMVVDPEAPRVLLDHEDVSHRIRSEEVTSVVSEVATNLEARAILGALQRAIIARETTGGRSGGAGIVVEGRDITTHIAPDAPVRVLLTADPEVRVARRAAEGVFETVARARSSILDRDARDSGVREFHRAADGVVTIDTTDLSIEEVVAAILGLAKEAQV